MAVDPFTHKFNFTVSGQFIRGNVEFNTDGEVSFEMNEWSTPLSLHFLHDFIKSMEGVQHIYENDGIVDKIDIRKK